MKKQLLLIFMFVAFVSKAQQPVVFCPPGAEWKYLSTSMLSSQYQIYAYPKVKYLRDSLMEGETVKVLSYDVFYSYDDYKNLSDFLLFLKQYGDTVFMKCSKTMNTWQILYNFAATAGQQWLTTVQDNNEIPITHTITVNATSTASINGKNLKRLFVTYCYTNPENGVIDCRSGSITERIGYQGTTFCCLVGSVGQMGFLFNYYKRVRYTDYDWVVDFLCYRDNNFSPTSFSYTRDCDYKYDVGIKENYLNQINLSVYPNPVNEILNIETENKSEELYITFIDMLGREVKQSPLQKEIQVQDLSKGIYILQVKNKTKEILYQQKLVKQ